MLLLNLQSNRRNNSSFRVWLRRKDISLIVKQVYFNQKWLTLTVLLLTIKKWKLRDLFPVAWLKEDLSRECKCSIVKSKGDFKHSLLTLLIIVSKRLGGIPLGWTQPLIGLNDVLSFRFILYLSLKVKFHTLTELKIERLKT